MFTSDVDMENQVPQAIFPTLPLSPTQQVISKCGSHRTTIAAFHKQWHSKTLRTYGHGYTEGLEGKHTYSARYVLSPSNLYSCSWSAD
jgi:hypothetical protein